MGTSVKIQSDLHGDMKTLGEILKRPSEFVADQYSLDLSGEVTECRSLSAAGVGNLKR